MRPHTYPTLGREELKDMLERGAVFADAYLHEPEAAPAGTRFYLVVIDRSIRFKRLVKPPLPSPAELAERERILKSVDPSHVFSSGRRSR